MKKLTLKATVVLGVALIAFTACKKENMQTIATSDNNTEMTALMDQAVADMDNEVITGENPEEGIAFVNEGICADFLIEESDMDNTVVSRGTTDPNTTDADRLRNYARNNSIVACLRKLELSDRQVAAVKKAMRGYEECKASAVKRARAIFAELKARYHAKAEYLIKLYKAGRISQEKFERAMKELRISFHKELRSLQLKEKLDAAMKNCYGEFLKNLKNILTERQWKALVSCHRH